MVSALKIYFLLVIGLTTSGFLVFILLHPSNNNNQDPSVLHAVTNSTSPLYDKTQEQLHCVEFKIGAQRYNEVTGGSPFTPAEHDQVAICLESGAGTLPPGLFVCRCRL